MRLTLLLALFALLLSTTSLHAKEQAPIYHAIEPAFIVNIREESPRPRFMQVKIQVMSYDRAVISRLENNLPAVRHAMIMLLANQQGETMRNTQQREQVRAEALTTLQQTLAEVAGVREGLEALYFTDLVIQ